MTATLSASTAILKTKYPNGKLPQSFYTKHPLLDDVSKTTDFGGNNRVVAVQTETTQGASADFATALGSLAQGKYYNYTVTRVEDFSLARIKGQALKAAAGDANALVNLWENEMNGAMHTAMRSLAIHMYLDGSGARGYGSASTVTFTLAATGNFSAQSITNFAVGMRVQATSSIATPSSVTTADSGATATISAIDRSAGTLTSASNWSAQIPSLASSSWYLLRAGDASSVLTGLSGWLNGGPTTLFSLSRAPDPVRLSGLSYNATGIAMNEAVIEASARSVVEGGNPDCIYMHPRDYGNFKKLLDAKMTIPAPAKQAQAGFAGIMIEGESGPLKVRSDMNCPRNVAYMLESDQWELASIGPAPQILDFDSNNFLRVASDDAYEVRVGTYGQFLNRGRFVGCVKITNFGA